MARPVQAHRKATVAQITASYNCIELHMCYTGKIRVKRPFLISIIYTFSA